VEGGSKYWFEGGYVFAIFKHDCNIFGIFFEDAFGILGFLLFGYVVLEIIIVIWVGQTHLSVSFIRQLLSHPDVGALLVVVSNSCGHFSLKLI
jgi:hypothetical protein